MDLLWCGTHSTVERRREQHLNAAEYILETIAAHGVRHVFAIPGKGNGGFYDALAARRDRLRHVLAKHEQGAAYMADGYARAGAPFGVCLGISAGAAINLMGGAYSAHADSVPLLVLTGNAPAASFGRNAMMEFSGRPRRPDPARLFEPLTKRSLMVRAAKEVPDALAECLAAALGGRRGAAHLCVPADVQVEEVGLSRVPPPVAWDERPAPPPAVLDEAAAVLGAARHPVIVAGTGVVRSGAGAEVVALAEALGAPIVTTLKGKSAVPNDHPLCLGHVALGRSPAAERAVKAPEMDVLVAIGTTLSEWTNFAWDPAFARNAQVVQLDIDPAEITRVYPVRLAVIGDARAALAGVLARLRVEPALAARRRDAVGTLLTTVGKFDLPETRFADTVPLRPQAVISRLAAGLPDGTQLLADAGNNTFYTSHYYPLRRHDAFYMGGGCAAMGWSVAASIGVKLARPDRPVVNVAGDGGFMMNGMELETAAAHDVPVLWVILTDHALGMVKTFQTLFRGKDFIGCEFGDVEPARVAEGLGVRGLTIERLAELERAVADFLAGPRPTLLDVRIDGGEVPPGIMDRLGK
ncbi:MAG: thiamine pyrophosphate-binding protein [Candidatus Rokubacteria bacterium]|nr:thiamine pyrophosphate-binding protein [Candidatus Rokubacteria bacterium]